jgi:hypothetical protein
LLSCPGLALARRVLRIPAALRRSSGDLFFLANLKIRECLRRARSPSSEFHATWLA